MSEKEHISQRNDRSSQIRDELARLYSEQTDFYREGARSRHTETDLGECEKRRQLIRALFEELDELRKASEWQYTRGER